MPDAQRMVIRIKKGTDGELFARWDRVEPGGALEVVFDIDSRHGLNTPRSGVVFANLRGSAAPSPNTGTAQQ